MGQLILFTGGSRSGKSSMAVERAKELSEQVCFVATCVPQDDEMAARVAKHRLNRPVGWRVVEEPVNVAEAIGKINPEKYSVVLVDCIALWVCNLMHKAESKISTETQMAEEAQKVVDAAKGFSGDVIIVTNEVGMGVMPANAMARSYSDLIGRCNQVLAAGADRVEFVACGISLILKQR